MRIKELRKERRMSQIQLSLILNVSQPTVSSYETGERKPDSDTLIKLSEIFGTSVDYILGISDIRCAALLSDLELEESELINIYRKLSQKEKDRVFGFILNYTFDSIS